jgi:adenylate cyclase
MTIPNLDELTQAYFNAQTRRTLDTLERIAGRAPPAAGRLIPDPDDLPISDGRRIEATVMFLDICKFTQRPSETNQEQHVLLQVLALFFTEMIRIIEDHGGVVEKTQATGLWPISRTTRPRRAKNTPWRRHLLCSQPLLT